MELSPDLTPSFQLYISLQIGSKDASFPVPVAFSSLHCDRCMCVWRGEGGRGRERERGGREERERECVCVCVCVDGFIVECPCSLPPPPSVYLALRANDQVRRFINNHLHYIIKGEGQDRQKLTKSMRQRYLTVMCKTHINAHPRTHLSQCQEEKAPGTGKDASLEQI